MKTRGIGLLAALAAGGTLSALGAQFTTAHVIDAVKEKAAYEAEKATFKDA